MPAGLKTSATTARGSKLYIGEVVDIQDLPNQSEYEAMTWVLVGTVEDAGDQGDARADITFESLDTDRTEHLTGPADAGSQRVVSAYLPDDVGQIAMVAAQADSFNRGFKMELNNKPSVDYTNTIRYYSGRVMDARVGIGNARNVLRNNFQIGINSATIEVAPIYSTP